MVASELFYRPVYQLLWQLNKAFSNSLPMAFYAQEEIDLLGFASVAKHLPQLQYITQNPMVKTMLKTQGQKAKPLFSFPLVLIMNRHSMHKFPSSHIISVGMRHGPYHFKRLTKAVNYNRFDLYLFTSQADLAAAEKIGVNVGKAIGFPALDAAFDGSISKDDLDRLATKYRLNPEKASLLFTATWDKANMSAIDRWIHHLPKLQERYNIMVTLHPWMSAGYRNRLPKMPKVQMVASTELIPAIMLADLCVGDQSSVLGYCSALDKPMVTFALPPAARTLAEIDRLVKSFSISIQDFDELEAACERFLADPSFLSEQRAEANKLMFDVLDGRAGFRAAEAIKELLISKGIPC